MERSARENGHPSRKRLGCSISHGQGQRSPSATTDAEPSRKFWMKRAPTPVVVTMLADRSRPGRPNSSQRDDWGIRIVISRDRGRESGLDGLAEATGGDARDCSGDSTTCRNLGTPRSEDGAQVQVKRWAIGAQLSPEELVSMACSS